MSIGQGSEDYTVADIMARLFLQWLTPPNGQDILIALAAPILDAVEQTIELGAFTIREDEELLRQGTLIEIEQEMMRVISYNSVAKTVEVTRGEYRTTATAHAVPRLMLMNPSFPRATVFEAVADNIIQLYPKLYTATSENLVPINGNVASIEDGAVEVIEVWQGDFSSTVDVKARIVDFHPAVGGRAIILNRSIGTFWARYKRRMAKATAETDLLEDLGVDERWVNIVMAGAAADLMAGRDIEASHTEWVKSVLEAESIRVGTRMSIGAGLRQYRGMLLSDAAQEMDAEYEYTVQMNDPFAVVT